MDAVDILVQRWSPASGCPLLLHGRGGVLDLHRVVRLNELVYLTPSGFDVPLTLNGDGDVGHGPWTHVGRGGCCAARLFAYRLWRCRRRRRGTFARRGSTFFRSGVKRLCTRHEGA